MFKTTCGHCGEWYWIGNQCPCWKDLPRQSTDDDMNAAKAEIIQAERDRLAMLCERLPFGDTAQSFAAWIRNGGQA